MDIENTETAITDNLVDRLRYVAAANNEASLCHPSLLTGAANEIEALQAVVRLFLVDNDEHINYARTVHGELKVWVSGEKNYLSPSAAEAAVRAVDNGRNPA